MVRNYKSSEEWFKQADYDLKSAEVMFKGGRYVYVIFLCHLGLEKFLKGLYVRRFKKNAPKVHNLFYFTKELEIELPEDLSEFVDELNALSVPTRYPEELDNLVKKYKKAKASRIIKKTQELLLWLKKVE